MKEDVSFDEVKEVFTNYLKQKKQRKTSERYAILERIYRNDGHFNAESLYNDMQDDYRVSLATVYNTLELLIDCQLIIKHQFGLQVAQYEKIFGNNLHHHLVCQNCGRIKEFSDKSIKTAIQTKKFTNFQPMRYSLYMYGLCNKCKPKSKKIKK